MTLIYLGCAWLLGVYLGSLLHLPLALMALLVALCTVTAWVGRGRPRVSLLSFYLSVLLLGLWRYSLARPALVPGPLAAYNDGSAVTLRGLVVNEPVPRDRRSQLQVSVYELQEHATWQALRGQVLVSVPSYETFRYGDELEIRGKLQTPSAEGDFSYRDYLARRGIHSLLSYPQVSLLARDKGQSWLAFLYRLKRRTQAIIAAIFPEPEAGLLTGILLGSDEGIPQSLMEQFRATGTAHIIAISGFNIAVISACLVKICSRFLQRYVALTVSLSVILLYTILVGADPPVVRAALIGGLSSLALITGRKSDAPTSLAVAAVAMTAWQPFVLWDTGFLLSFVASLGIMVYASRFQQWVETALERTTWSETLQRALRFASETVFTTLAAQLTTLPLMLIFFHQFSLLSLLANTLVLPVQPALMYLGGAAAMVGWVSLRVGQVLGWAAWLFLTYTLRCVALISRWIGSSGKVNGVPTVFSIVYYGLLIICTYLPLRKRINVQALWQQMRREFSVKTTVMVLLAALVLVVSALSNLPDGRLHVTFLDVGQGDAILLQTPSGRHVLIDGGPSPSALLTALGRHLSFWDRHIDLVLVSHPHDDHLQGLLTLLPKYSIGQVLVSDIPCDSPLCKEWQAQLENSQISVLIVRQPLQIDLGDGPVLDVFPAQFSNPEQAQQASLVTRLSWQKAVCLFPGDLEADGLQRLALRTGMPLSCTLLKVPHHGSDKAVNEHILFVTHPKVAIISVGTGNHFGHPAPATLQLLSKMNIETWRTDLVGDIQFTTDTSGYHLSVRRATIY